MYENLIKDLRFMFDRQDCSHCANARRCDNGKCFLGDAANALENLERRVPTWIDPEIQLPPMHTRVIVAREYEAGQPLRVEQGMYMEGGWWKVYGTNVRKVKRWMWMPLPPEENG